MPKHKIANRAAWDRILESRIATALQVGSINQSQFDLAHREAERIMTELRTGYADVIYLCETPLPTASLLGKIGDPEL